MCYYSTECKHSKNTVFKQYTYTTGYLIVKCRPSYVVNNRWKMSKDGHDTTQELCELIMLTSNTVYLEIVTLDTFLANLRVLCIRNSFL